MKKWTLLPLVCGVMTLTACGGGSDEPPSPQWSSYAVSGTASRALVTYRVGTAVQQDLVTLPWSSFPGPASPGTFLYVSAQNQGATGTVTVTIRVGDKTFKSATSTAPYGIATADGTCC